MTRVDLTTTATLNGGEIKILVYEDSNKNGSFNTRREAILSGGADEVNELTGFDTGSSANYWIEAEQSVSSHTDTAPQLEKVNIKGGSGEIVTIDGFEDYVTDLIPGNWTVEDGHVTDQRSATGLKSYDNNKEASLGNYVIYNTGLGGEKPNSIEFSYRETSASSGIAYYVKDTNGNTIVSVGTTNPEWVVEDSSGSTILESSPSSLYGEWRKVTIDIDWSNEQFDVTWEDLTGSTNTQSQNNSDFINTGGGGIDDVGAGSYDFPGIGNDANSKGDEWVDDMWGVSK
jgi:hypothetical protein